MKKGEGGARGIFWFILANLGEIGGGGRLLPLSTLDFTNICAVVALRWVWRTFYVPAGGWGCERTPQPTALQE